MSTTEQRKHHPYSPSTLQSTEACPSYEGQQSETPHERTVAGTIAHGVVESGVDDNRLSDEDAAYAAECLDFVEKRRELLEEARRKERWRLAVEFADGDIPDAYLTQAEDEVGKVQEIKEAYWPVDEQHTTAGYADHVLISWDGKYAEIIDYKFGRWYVESAHNNLQGIAYALGVFHRFSSVQRIKVLFKQPLLEHVSEAEFTRDAIPALYQRVVMIVERAKRARASGDFANANPGVPICTFCKNIGRCPAVAKLMINVGQKFYPAAVPEDITPSVLLNSRDTLTGLQLAQIAGTWAKAYRTQATDRIIRGDADLPPGHRLEQKSNREIVNMALFKQIAKEYLTPEQLDAISEVGFGKIETIIKDAAPRNHKKEAVEAFGQKLLDSGAVVRGQPFTYLKSVPQKPE